MSIFVNGLAWAIPQLRCASKVPTELPSPATSVVEGTVEVGWWDVYRFSKCSKKLSIVELPFWEIGLLICLGNCWYFVGNCWYFFGKLLIFFGKLLIFFGKLEDFWMDMTLKNGMCVERCERDIAIIYSLCSQGDGINTKSPCCGDADWQA